MKKALPILLSIFLFVLILSGGILYMKTSPRGPLQANSSDSVVKDWLQQQTEDSLKQLLLDQYTSSLTEFENPDIINNHVCNSFTFNNLILTEEKDKRTTETGSYILSTDSQELFQIQTQYIDKHWKITDITLLPISLISHDIIIVVPANSELFVNDIIVDSDYISNNIPYANFTSLENICETIPSQTEYTISGLYAEPTIQAYWNETELVAKECDGYTIFSNPLEEQLYNECHERIELFIENMCEYGGGHITHYDPKPYCVPDTDLYSYFSKALSSLNWVVYVTINFNEISSSDYVFIDTNSFVCRGHVDMQVTTLFQDNHIVLDYEMLWTNNSGQWLIQDLTFI